MASAIVSNQIPRSPNGLRARLDPGSPLLVWPLPSSDPCSPPPFEASAFDSTGVPPAFSCLKPRMDGGTSRIFLPQATYGRGYLPHRVASVNVGPGVPPQLLHRSYQRPKNRHIEVPGTMIGHIFSTSSHRSQTFKVCAETKPSPQNRPKKQQIEVPGTSFCRSCDDFSAHPSGPQARLGHCERKHVLSARP
jgi:hypothetical protein